VTGGFTPEERPPGAGVESSNVTGTEADEMEEHLRGLVNLE
jgi:hypothetical protein